MRSMMAVLPSVVYCLLGAALSLLLVGCETDPLSDLPSCDGPPPDDVPSGVDEASYPYVAGPAATGQLDRSGNYPQPAFAPDDETIYNVPQGGP